MKRFKNVFVGTTADFATLTVDGASDPTLADGVKIPLGFVFVNQENGIVWILSTYETTKFWVRTDNKAATGYNS